MPSPEEQAQLDAMKQKTLQRQGDVEAEEDKVFAQVTPKGDFHKKALNSLVDATNKLLPLFGITDKYEKFTEDVKELPVDFARLLTMFAKMIDDAIAAGILEEDNAIQLEAVTDDTTLLSLAGRIGVAAKSPKLKKWLKSPPAPKAEEAPAPPVEARPADEPDPNALFAERM